MITYNPNVLNNLTGHSTTTPKNTNYTEQQILNLFQDNLTGNIDPADLRLFVEAIWTAKENTIIKITDPKHYDFHKIKKDQLVIITEPNNTQGKNGVYVAKKDSPSFKDFDPVQTEKHIKDFIKTGKDGQVLTTENGVIKWVTPYQYQIHGTIPYQTIITKVNPQKGDTYISENNFLHTIKKGDALQWNGTSWKNIGSMIGPQGQASHVPGPQGSIGPQGPQGFTGPRGNIGPKGIQGPKGGGGIPGRTGPMGITGITGPTGPVGLKGEQGHSLTPCGTTGSKVDLDLMSPTDGDIWFITANPVQDVINDGHGFIWIIKPGDTKHSWFDMGNFQGPRGIKGDQGTIGSDGATGPQGKDGNHGSNGPDGKSAYQVWLDNGNHGSEQHFLDSLKGKDANAANLKIEFDNLHPTPQTIGGIKKGSTFDKVKLEDMWQQLLYPYQNPSIISVDLVDSKGHSINSTVPVGTPLDKNITIKFRLNEPHNLKDEISITDGTKTIKLTKNDISGTMAYTTALDLAVGSKMIWTVTATDTNNNTIRKSTSVTWANFAYWGKIDKDSLDTGDTAEIIKTKAQGMGGDMMMTPLPKMFFTASAVGAETKSYRYVVYPDSAGPAKSIQQDNFDIAMLPGFDIAAHRTINMTVNGKSAKYYVYITNQAIFGDLKMKVR